MHMAQLYTTIYSDDTDLVQMLSDYIASAGQFKSFGICCISCLIIAGTIPLLILCMYVCMYVCRYV